MLDDELREQLAEWVRPVITWPVPDIRVLRRRARRRGIRRAAAAAAITAVVAAVAVGVTVNLPGTGARPAGGSRPVPGASPSWSPAPGTWHHGAWQPAGPPLAPDASPADAPYIVLPWNHGGLQVRNVFTGAHVAYVAPPSGQYLVGVAGAEDDRTFVVWAEMGGRTQGGIGPPVGATVAAFDELRLGPDGQPESLRLLFSIPWNGSMVFAISQDASMLAYLTDSGFETVTPAAGTGRSWSASHAGGVASLSWAGDRTLAFEWRPAENPHPPGIGIRVLDVTAPGNLLQISQLIIPYGQYCAALGACQDGQLITADGSKMLVTRVVAVGQNYADSVVEYSARTGQRLADVMPTIRTPYAGPPCVPLWTDPSGEQVISFCGGHGELYDQGRLSRVTLHPPMYGMNFGAAFAW
jgi:hypothetical protein